MLCEGAIHRLPTLHLTYRTHVGGHPRRSCTLCPYESTGLQVWSKRTASRRESASVSRLIAYSDGRNCQPGTFLARTPKASSGCAVDDDRAALGLTGSMGQIGNPSGRFAEPSAAPG